jgi:hypothetical protein
MPSNFRLNRLKDLFQPVRLMQRKSFNLAFKTHDETRRMLLILEASASESAVMAPAISRLNALKVSAEEFLVYLTFTQDTYSILDSNEWLLEQHRSCVDNGDIELAIGYDTLLSSMYGLYGSNTFFNRLFIEA